MAARRRVQPPSARRPTIGYLGSSTELGESRWVGAFVQRLSQLGWVEGCSITIEYR
jgi:putative ABC transport system substrate-binding protein